MVFRSFIIGAFVFLISAPSAFAQEAPTRRDTFLQLWNSIKRPAFEVYDEFSDLPEGSPGYLEISYGLNRGIIDDAERFYPNEPIDKDTALLWLFRTRNVDDLDKMTPQAVPGFIEEYGITIGEDINIESWMQQLDRSIREQVHGVSYYADDFHGAGTAFGETFDMHALTAAHRTYPHNTLVKVTNQENDETVIVRINDRGPYVEGRALDLSLAAFESISPRSRGVIQATIERLGDRDLVDQVSSSSSSSTSNSSSQSSSSSTAKPACKVASPLLRKRISQDVYLDRGVPGALAFGDELKLTSDDYFVVRKITGEDNARFERWISPDEKFTYTPQRVGLYSILLGNAFGKHRSVRFEVRGCE